MDESIQKALLRCVFRVFTVSHDPASHTGDFFHMTFAKLSERSSSPTFGGCDQLLLAPRSKIADCCVSALRRKKCTYHYGDVLSQTGAANCLFPQFFPLSIHSRTYSGQFSSFIPRTSHSLRNFTASRSASLTSCKS